MWEPQVYCSQVHFQDHSRAVQEGWGWPGQEPSPLACVHPHDCFVPNGLWEGSEAPQESRSGTRWPKHSDRQDPGQPAVRVSGTLTGGGGSGLLLRGGAPPGDGAVGLAQFL